jgi:hypothetical protein
MDSSFGYFPSIRNTSDASKKSALPRLVECQSCLVCDDDGGVSPGDEADTDDVQALQVSFSARRNGCECHGWDRARDTPP